MAKKISVHDRFKALRQANISTSGAPVPEALQGITKACIAKTLSKLSLNTNDQIDCVFALLDDTSHSFPGIAFSKGAATAHLGAHISLLQRGNDLKLDREGRDYWIKPLINAGVIEPVTLVNGEFVQGHVKAKSPNSSYRITKEFLTILRCSDDKWEANLTQWINNDSERRRLRLESSADAASMVFPETGHAKLIKDSIEIYAKHFLPGFEVLYVDDSDGQRISEDEEVKLKKAGVAIGLEDAFPDALLWNPETDKLWCIEAVTSDGEVDAHKVRQLQKLAHRSGKSGVGFTTTYLTWKTAASRQSRNRNLAIGTYLWIASDPSRQFEVGTFGDAIPPDFHL